MPFSSGMAIFIIMALRPKAIGFSSNEMFFPPSASISDWADFFMDSRLTSGDSGINFTIIDTTAMLCFVYEGF